MTTLAYAVAVDLEPELRTHGYRVTTARRAVWDVLSANGDHLTAPAITSRVHAFDPSINGASVYRALTLFAELGLVRESRYEDASTWEPFHDDAAIHLVCSECGRVMHHDTELVLRLRRAIQVATDFAPDEIDVSVSGRCGHCPAASST
jgi:Fe2+ or Zn2+ uptake regulation protein